MLAGPLSLTATPPTLAPAGRERAPGTDRPTKLSVCSTEGHVSSAMQAVSVLRPLAESILGPPC
eukprot:13856244-Alexandrium_andersonii.AAC.1